MSTEKVRELTAPEQRIMESRVREVESAEQECQRARGRLARARQAASDVVAAFIGGHDESVQVKNGVIYRDLGEADVAAAAATAQEIVDRSHRLPGEG